MIAIYCKTFGKLLHLYDGTKMIMDWYSLIEQIANSCIHGIAQ